MSRIRVLVVDDSLTVRQRLTSILDADPGIELLGEAPDGKRAIELCQLLRPDVVTLDIMMPVMTGLAATEYIMAHCPTPILIVSASINRAELFKTYDALAAGAVDVLEKPRGDEPAGDWEQRFLSAVKLVSRIRVITHPRARLVLPAGAPPGENLPGPPRRPCRIAAIGASTGGPGALVQVLRDVPRGFTQPILFVLHIDEPFGSAFASWLDAQTGHPVIMAEDGQAVASLSGKIVMAPPGKHLLMRANHLHLSEEDERHACRPSVDVLFESVAAEYGQGAAACLLTGMGRDGATGMLAVRQAGGATLAQDEATSVVYGMPREAARLGAAEHILPLSDLGRALAGILADPRSRRS